MRESFSLMYEIFFFGTSHVMSQQYNSVQRRYKEKNSNIDRENYIFPGDEEKIDSKSLHEFLNKPKENRKTQKKSKRGDSEIELRGTDGLNSTQDGKCMVGVQYFAFQSQPLCGGRVCRVYELECDGELYTNFTLYEGDYAQNCTVTKIICDLYEIQDLKEQQNSSNCKIEKLLCSNQRERNTSQPFTDEQLQTCLVQLTCDNSKRFGYDYFGFSCVNETIQCDGNNNCTITKESCPSGLTNTTMCTDYDVLCEGGTSPLGCKFQKLRSQCNTNQLTPECKISKIDCNGVISDIGNSTAASIKNCSIVEVNCNNGANIWTNQTYSGRCVVDQFICNNQTFSSLYNGPLDNCTISKMNCFGNVNGSPNNCSNYEFACTNAPVCDYTLRRFTCVNADTCVGSLNTTLCICPIDRLGDDCGKYNHIRAILLSNFPPLIATIETTKKMIRMPTFSTEIQRV